ncbi:MAG: DUF2760 domain-containing protein [Desulfobacterales bacterium]|nr:DUF2760 domain-containing protein [Desulfobacterales bacterium]
MNIPRSYSRISLVWILFFFVAFALMVNAAAYLGFKFLYTAITALNSAPAESAMNQIHKVNEQFVMIEKYLNVYFIPISFAVFIIGGFLLWIIIRSSLANALDMAKPSSKMKKKDISVDPSLIKMEKKKNDQRLFLYLLSILQREGRLVDFFFEDLNLYEDAQIGAAVRSIHENCSKTVKKYLSPKPVIDKNEGDQITVPPDFDPDTIKLTGNVTGEPPFKGILRHRGWQVSKLELPTLSGEKDTKILAPAEVEVT